ncbi:MAG TPA: hydroxyisourate hydrolase [Polyangiaceae bacterium]|jgi:5-hydroxyisourate hydrolase|nr:hydroxyisourate hydrolase [Polyangiaceae bacterium]
MITISSHVLDTALGRPARDVPVRLERLDGGQWSLVAQAVTDDDGRVLRLTPDAGVAAGTYRVTFDTEAYFGAGNRPVFYPRVDVVFVVTAGEHYHVPLLVSPFGYSTYRGS